MGSTSDDDLEAEIDRLYRLPLKAFTPERNALAARLKERGRPEAAGRVKSLAKPTASAWAVNQLFWASRREFDELIDASDRLRALQARGVTPNELRDAMRERREAVAAALRRAEAALVEQGHSANADLKQRVATTLESLAAHGSGLPGEIRPGRFTEDLSPPGFEALTALGPIPAPAREPAGAGRPGRDEVRQDEGPQDEGPQDDERARAERLRLERELALRRRRAEEAQTAADEMARRAEGAQRELAEAERRLARAQERAEETRAAAERARAAADQAADERRAAERALEAAGGPPGPRAS